MDKIKQLISIIEDWEELIDHARYECTFDEPLDIALFKRCMKEAYGYFFPEKALSRVFETFEAELFGKICAYSYVPAVTEGENSVLFDASTHAAGMFSYAILHPEAVNMENGKMIDELRVDGEFKPVEYDFESGDLKDYIELVKIGFWD